jgi:hypothetical protein
LRSRSPPTPGAPPASAPSANGGSAPPIPGVEALADPPPFTLPQLTDQHATIPGDDEDDPLGLRGLGAFISPLDDIAAAFLSPSPFDAFHMDLGMDLGF